MTLFRQWREKLRLANESHEDDGGGLDEQVWEIEEQIYSTAADSAVGLAIKAAMLIQMEEECGAFEESEIYAHRGRLRFDLRQ